MRKKPNKKLIGTFTLIGIALFIGSILFFLKDRISSNDEDLIVMYFDESIKGLSIGSSVVFRGVEVGKITKIDLIVNNDGSDFNIPVFMKLNVDQNFVTFDNEVYKDKKKFLSILIEKGLAARLKTQSLLTGQLMVELEILQNPNRKTKNDSKLDNLEIPTVLSTLSELSQGFYNLPIAETLNNINRILASLDTQIPLILNNTNIFIGALNKILAGEKENVSLTILNMNKALIDISNAARSLKNFTDYIERHPESLIKGKAGY